MFSMAEALCAIDCLFGARRATLTELVEACQSMVIKYGYSGDDFLCRESVNREECDSLSYGYMIKHFQRLDVWPGNPQDIADRMNSTSVETLWTDLKKLNSPTFPHNGHYHYNHYSQSYGHEGCSWSSTLHAELDTVVRDRVSKVMEVYRGHFEQQLRKLDVSKDGILDELQISKDL